MGRLESMNLSCSLESLNIWSSILILCNLGSLMRDKCDNKRLIPILSPFATMMVMKGLNFLNSLIVTLEHFSHHCLLKGTQSLQKERLSTYTSSWSIIINICTKLSASAEEDTFNAHKFIFLIGKCESILNCLEFTDLLNLGCHHKYFLAIKYNVLQERLIDFSSFVRRSFIIISHISVGNEQCSRWKPIV